MKSERWTVHHGDALDVLRSMPTASVDAIVTDPPSGIGFMNAAWDKDKGGRVAWVAWLAEIFTEARRVAKPGAHALVWALPRTSHWTATGLEDAGWELRDRVAHFFGTGFPKSHNLGGDWEGWGTALKPAVEDWHLARAPLSEGTVAANVARWGCGALAIDACRIGRDVDDVSGWSSSGSKAGPNLSMSGANTARDPKPDSTAGRWPAHLVLDEEAAAMLDEQSGDCPSASNDGPTTGGKIFATGAGIPQYENGNPYRGETGGASRFFFCASWSEREKCDLATTANETSSPTSERVASAPSGAATSGRLAGKRCDDSRAPSTNATPKPSRPSVDDGTPQTRRTGRKSSRASAHESTSSSDPARCVETRRPTAITTTTASRSTSASSVASATSPITGTSLGRGDRDFARFLFCAKPSTAEREMGLDGFRESSRAEATGRKEGSAGSKNAAAGAGGAGRRNIHPTVKSVALMRWLMRLITPPGGLVLDLFTGSGTTGIAAMCEGVRFVGVEQSEEFAAIARARIAFAAANPRAFDPDAVKGAKPDARQVDLFGGTGT